MPVSFETALRKVTEAIAQLGDDCEIMQEETKETALGWVFFWQSSAYLKSGNFEDQLIGNCPVLVRFDGSVELLPTHTPWEESVEKLLRRL